MTSSAAYADRAAAPAGLCAPAERRRILHFLSIPVRGGVEEHALSIVTALRAQGFEPYLAAPRALLESMAPELSACNARTFELDRVSPLAIGQAARFIAFLRREHIALVHSHHFVASAFASPLARLAGVPGVIETFHLRETWREGKWLKGSFWLDRRVAGFVNRYIAVSRAVADHLIQNKRIERSKVTTIYNGRDLGRFRPPERGAMGRARAELGVRGKQVLAVTARLEWQKGHTTMLAAIRLLAPRWPRLVVLFAGSGALEADLRAERDALGLSERVIFLGARSDPENVLAAADVAVLPSRFEGLPLAAIEALAMARPMVATDVEGTREIVIDGKTGLLAKSGDPVALAAAIERILADPALGAALGAAGRSMVENNFDVRGQIAATAGIYREVLKMRGINR